jgi:hypothetical protein
MLLENAITGRRVGAVGTKAVRAGRPDDSRQRRYDQSPLAWFCEGTKTRRGRAGSGCMGLPSVWMIPITRAYAARTPILTEATTVKQRMMGIKNGFTINQPLLSAYLMQSSTIRILRSFPFEHFFQQRPCSI